MTETKLKPKFDPKMINELARSLFIADQLLPEGKTFEDVKEERKVEWKATKLSYIKKAKKLSRVMKNRDKLVLELN